MPDDNYWEDDELQDRLYHAREREKQYSGPNGRRFQFTWPFGRSRTIPVICGLVFLILFWRTLFSGERPAKLKWSRYAYSLYATDTHSLCNALMVFASLYKFGSKADRVLLYPQEWEGLHEGVNGRLLHIAEQKYGVKLEPVELVGADGRVESPGTLDKPSDWNLSITKLRAFDLIQYDRVLHLDSDITLNQHMDELFLLPSTPIAMPRAYWSDGDTANYQLTSLVMLLEPNPNEVTTMLRTLAHWQSQPDYATSQKYDMDLLNHRFAASAMVLPHRPYAMLTAEFRAHNHSTYLGYPAASDTTKPDPRGEWDTFKALREAKLVHFSDWPLPKPWIMWPEQGRIEMQPDCGGPFKGTCSEREVWKGLYSDFRERRKAICKILPVPAPDWTLWKQKTGAGGSD